MKKYFTTNIGRLRLLAFLEGVSLIALVFIAVPLKHIYDNPFWVKSIGPVHGILFLFFVANAFSVAASLQWKFKETTWKVLLSSFIPFGTFYIDYTILKKISDSNGK